MAIVRILPIEEGSLRAKIVTLDVVRSGRSERLTISMVKDLNLKMGDLIRCVSGSAVAMINPGTQAGAFILTTNLPYGSTGKHVTSLSITPHTLRVVERGHITSAEDIGTTLTSTAAATR